MGTNGSISKELEEDDILPNEPTDRQAHEEQERQIEVEGADTNRDEEAAEIADGNEEDLQQALLVESPNIHSKEGMPTQSTHQTLKAKKAGNIE